MPQPTQHSLVHVLLLWTTILSIIHLVSIVLFFTAGHFGPSQSCTTAKEPTMRFRAMNKTKSGSEFLLGKGRMANFESLEVHPNKTIKWKVENSADGWLSDGYVLKLPNDGYYFLNLRVTLNCEEQRHNQQELDKVSVKMGGKDLLQGWINAQTCSTGVLSKSELLPAGSTLMVTITSSQIINISEDGSLTYLSIIYIENP